MICLEHRDRFADGRKRIVIDGDDNDGPDADDRSPAAPEMMRHRTQADRESMDALRDEIQQLKDQLEQLRREMKANSNR